MSDVLTTGQVAQKLGVSLETVRRLIDRQYFPGAFRLGRHGHWRIPAADVEAVRQGKPGQSPQVEA